jgi:hypothetical protein
MPEECVVGEPERDPKQPSQADVDHAIALLKRGTRPVDVRKRLMQRGLPEDVAGLVVYDGGRGIRAEAADVLDAHRSDEDAVRALRERGFSERAATALIGELEDLDIRAAKREQRSAGVVAMAVGGSLFLIGGGLVLGNETGEFLTWPVAGYLVMAVGALLFAWGETHSTQ